MRLIFGLLAVIGVAGCGAGIVPASGGGGGSTSAAAPASDGEARKLRMGMTSNDAFGVFGPESGFERNPDNFDQSCLSYAYGSAEVPKYVHAVFENDVLVRATDGHPGLCTFEVALADEVL